ncbi:WAT1-related protein At2g39510-like [Amborella trichopoda]|uniref:WAT1-related protein At2g39510-like n=1 Tax=Amborella trichopoda TaxID=13333 RepID=UPI0009C0AE55|nr:WAT1-related protein At2g39510-like [Amborella trichopoda]|eukprot:XP_020532172.1 WAT1-related protein At2g39510-like [Amborella trichopoda]
MFMLGGGTVSWKTKKYVVALSIMEVEYVAYCLAANEAIKKFLNRLDFHPVHCEAVRLEKVNVKSIRNIARKLGTVVCLGGAVVLRFIKGPSIDFVKHLKTPKFLYDILFPNSSVVSKSNWTLGLIFLVLSDVGYLTWAFKVYPAPLSLTVMILFVGTIQTDIIVVIFDSIKKKGPIFASAFSPLCIVIVAVMEPILLKLDIYVGSIVRIVMVICGLYSLFWGKAKDKEDESHFDGVSKKYVDPCQIGERAMGRSCDDDLLSHQLITFDDFGGEKTPRVLYVDDMLLACKDKARIDELKASLSKSFEMKGSRSGKANT